MVIVPIRNTEDLLLALSSIYEQSGFIILDYIISRSNQVSKIYFLHSGMKSIANLNNLSDHNQLIILKCKNLKINTFSYVIGEFVLEEKNKKPNDHSLQRGFVIGLTLSKISNINDILTLLNEVDNIVTEFNLGSNDYLEEIIILQVKKKSIYVFIITVSNNYILISEIMVQLLFLANKLDISFVNPKVIPSILRKLISNRAILKGNKLKIEDNKRNKSTLVRELFEYFSRYIENESNNSAKVHTILKTSDMINDNIDSTNNKNNKIDNLLRRVKVIMDEVEETELYLKIFHSIKTDRSYNLHFSYIGNKISYRIFGDNSQTDRANLKSPDLILELISHVDRMKSPST